MRAKRIIFMGSFDPFHKGHLTIVNQLKILHDVNGGGTNWLHIIPAYQNPNKKKPMFTYDDRVQIIKCNVYNRIYGYGPEQTNVIVDDIEQQMSLGLKKGAKIYSVNVLREFCRKHLDDKIIWALTQETYDELKDDKWYDSEECLSIPDSIEIVKIEPLFAKIHSTQIREALLNNDNGFLNENLFQLAVDITKEKFEKQANKTVGKPLVEQQETDECHQPQLGDKVTVDGITGYVLKLNEEGKPTLLCSKNLGSMDWWRAVKEASKSPWYFPSVEELQDQWQTINKLDIINGGDWYWSSTEDYENKANAFYVGMHNGFKGNPPKDWNCKVRAFAKVNQKQ